MAFRKLMSHNNTQRMSIIVCEVQEMDSCPFIYQLAIELIQV